MKALNEEIERRRRMACGVVEKLWRRNSNHGAFEKNDR